MKLQGVEYFILISQPQIILIKIDKVLTKLQLHLRITICPGGCLHTTTFTQYTHYLVSYRSAQIWASDLWQCSLSLHSSELGRCLSVCVRPCHRNTSNLFHFCFAAGIVNKSINYQIPLLKRCKCGLIVTSVFNIS